ncbi:CaiB/BaiF CoA-transferase family protein [Gordonia sp. ABSL1-1]|uniref:CaiB/BaiF CoA transferase family protein n=1 Tax=Gordonia sp. ABSL1-1 TaxID=3053923 RepID=UPI002573D71A|nr:CaiB/BaiF CoA-transferase family protein [Gordonia sp. ABSL1-1]MDL9935438.1 CaiB/BaiF CoA-transferase family protein [Gordonia sp. ABSL1-1]
MTAASPLSPTDPARPLRGVRVVELSGIGPSRYAGLLLAELGADVVLVERPGQGPKRADSVVGRGRRQVVADLKSADGIATVLELIAAADVVIDPFRPGVAERLGLGPDVCRDRNRGLVYGRMTGWGQDGPLADAAGHDIDYIAITGILDAIGPNDGPPQVPLNLVGDFGGGTMFLVLGIVSALFDRQRSGQGRVVDAAIVDGALSLAGFIFGMRADGHWVDERGANVLDGGAPYYGVYETADGGWMAVGAIEPQFYTLFTSLLGLDDVPAQHDRDGWPQLRKAIAERFATRTRDEWTAVFEGTDACVSPVLSFPEAADHSHIAARGALREVDGVLTPAPAPRFDGIVGRPAAALTHTESAAVLADWAAPDVS